MEHSIPSFEKFLNQPQSRGFLLDKIPSEQYHEDRDFITKHMLDLFARSPEKYHYAMNVEQPEATAPMILGEAFHTMVLEPDEFDERFMRIPDNIKVCRGKAWEEFSTTYAFKKFIKGEEFDKLPEMVKALKKNALADQLLFHGRSAHNELTVLFRHEEVENRPCKARIDRLLLKEKIILDLKTTADASPDAFMRSVVKFRYDVQGAFYIDAMKRATDLDGWRFAIVAIEKEAPYSNIVYFLDDWIDLGRETYLRDLAGLVSCEAYKRWEGYSVPDGKLPLPPDWVIRSRGFI